MSGDIPTPDNQPDIVIENASIDPTPPNSSAPTRKVTASALGAAFSTVVMAIIQMVSGADVPIGVEGALAVIFGFLAGYITTD